MMTIECDNKFNIIKCNQNTVKYTEYIMHDLIRKPITILMPDIVKGIHERIFESMKTMGSTEIRKIGKKLRTSMKNIRYVNIKTKSNHIIHCIIDVILKENRHCVVNITPIKWISNPLVPVQFLPYITNKPSLNLETSNDIICIMMDMANSTEYGRTKSSYLVGELYHNVYKEIDEIITDIYYPYVYVHETCGDSFVIILNMPFMRCHPQSYELSVNICIDILKKVNRSLLGEKSPSLYLRCGIAVGELSYGVIDGKTFRVFGNTINLASRLESMCEYNHINLSKEIYSKIRSKASYDMKDGICKGIGKCKYYSVHIDDIIPYELETNGSVY